MTFRIKAVSMMIGVMAAMCSVNGYAFDAQTRLTNVPLSDKDVGTALSKGLAPEFDRKFPQKEYGVYVFIDAISGSSGKQLVYMSVGLSKKLPDGKYLAQHANASSAEVIDSALSPEEKKKMISSGLSELSAQFSHAMIEHYSQVK